MIDVAATRQEYDPHKVAAIGLVPSEYNIADFFHQSDGSTSIDVRHENW